MPRVPVYGQPQVSTSPLPGVRVQAPPQGPDRIGQGLASAASALGRVEDAQLRFQMEADQSAAREKANLFKTKADDLERRLRDLQGTAAFGGADAAEKDLDAFRSELVDSLTNERQRSFFSSFADDFAVGFQDRVRDYQAQQARAHKDATDAAYLANQVDEAKRAWDDPFLLDIRARVVAQNVASMNIERGAGHAEVEQAQRRAATDVYGTAIQQQIDAGAIELARETLGKVRDQIDAEAADKLAEALEAGNLRARSQAKADEILAKTRDLAEARTLWKEIDDPQLRDAVQQRVEHEIGVLERAETQRQEDLFVQAWRMATQAGGDPDALPSSVLTDLSPHRAEALERWMRTLRDPGKRSHDARRWLSFRGLTEQELQRMTQGEFLVEYGVYFDEAHYDKAVEHWSAAQSGGNKETFQATQTFNDIVNSLAQGAGIMPAEAGGVFGGGGYKPRSKWTQEEADRFQAFEDAAAREIEAESRLQGRKLSGQEMRDVLKRHVLRTVFVDRPNEDDPELPLYQVPEAERIRAYGGEEIPAAEQAAIIQLFFHGLRRAVDPIKVRRIYQASLQYRHDPARFREAARQIAAE